MPYFMNSPHKSILAALYDCFPAANAVLVFLLDHPLAWFTPKWRRKGTTTRCPASDSAL